MGDNISRQGLLLQIEKDADGSPGWYGDTWQFIKTIKSMPSTDRKGHWKIYDHVDRIGRVIGEKICVCDQCKETVTLSWRAKVPNFCPHCGADMRGVDDESTL